MSGKNYVLAESWNKANIQNRVFYIMDAQNLEELKDGEALQFGDKALCIKTGIVYVFGNDGIFYQMGGSN